ncbi:Trehalose-phosphate phosphatase [Corynebacterium capitovis DSM 44611]|uniref:trehalose-phosphatase n=1 Tax=Corynebacterium capitovis TaxID=131081 RepID=UPI000371F2C3|nr:trehalose-phosphatase [Corynebacterium capitovis]WKD58128.1 Trehalose-phosphate phosphatase [Corynebacterium capitovis DSM 44611]
MTTRNDALRRLAAAESLLVCLDFDGTLAELATDPYAVRTHPTALRALTVLSETPSTTVAVLSGRHLDGLRRVFPLGDPVVLVGSHGAEPTQGAVTLSEGDTAYLDRIQDVLEELAQPPAYVEVKPYQRVLHVAPLAERDSAAAEALLARAARIDTGGRPVTEGRNVVEFSAVDVTKGSWLARFKQGFDATLFAGDDTTDESALSALGPRDVGIKVGPKPTVAPLRVARVEDMAAFLSDLARERRRYAPE